MNAPVKERPVTTRLPVKDIDRIEELAAKADRSRSAELRRAVRMYIEREGKAS